MDEVFAHLEDVPVWRAAIRGEPVDWRSFPPDCVAAVDWPAERLVDWQPEDGWAPLCAALGVPVPDEPFPHLNTRADWHADGWLPPPRAMIFG